MLPKRLFSHNDQQSTWMSFTPERSQLRAMARTMSVLDALGASRVVFFVAPGGFDTRSAQA
jgi:uncharacterized protein (DUF1501 family)